ncbi:MAG TPA: hypothetical protein VNO81_10205, partial [Candidatus Nitrosotenuis sp.]|nr:hypothetical protein [Candidatus Nitrosotenuis sp.]
MLLGACYIPDFPVWALRFLEPSLRSRELIVVSGGRVVARSQGPRRLGVEVGWPAERARALAPQALVRVDPGPALELAAEELLAELNRLTPWIEPVSAGQVVLGLDRPAEARPLARRLGLQIGLAEDRDTALLAALQAAPGQVLALAEEQGQAFRQGFPLARLVEIGISPRTVERLEWLGFPTVGSLARLSEAQLTRQFPEGARLHRMVRGADRRPVALYSPPPALTLAVDLDPPQLEPGLAEAALVHLLDQAIERLEGRVAGTLTVGLQAGEQATASRRVLHAP